MTEALHHEITALYHAREQQRDAHRLTLRHLNPAEAERSERLGRQFGSSSFIRSRG